ncbi:NUDIX hydrolase [Solibacillus sp. CAU 1738]|uniref:NUDIX hydrolase n=1 Tax=Solibacillus sp. CAU 1738 TaxID=3140363 RepID=UPI00325FEC80
MIRTAVGAIIYQGKEILLVHKVKISSIKNSNNHISGDWDFLKGGVEEDDKDLQDALLRELEEETGSTNYKIIKQLDEKISFSFPEDVAQKIGYIKQETTMYIVEYLGDGSDLMPKDDEINAVEFLNSDEVFERLTHQDTKEFYVRVQSKMKE